MGGQYVIELLALPVGRPLPAGLQPALDRFRAFRVGVPAASGAPDDKARVGWDR
jgi:hypothetical protein